MALEKKEHKNPNCNGENERKGSLLGFTGFYRVLLGFTEFYWVLLGFDGFY